MLPDMQGAIEQLGEQDYCGWPTFSSNDSYDGHKTGVHHLILSRVRVTRSMHLGSTEQLEVPKQRGLSTSHHPTYMLGFVSPAERQ